MATLLEEKTFARVHEGWLDAPLRADIMNALARVDLATSCPGAAFILEAYRRLRPEDVRVVIVGQDPYPRHSDACGIAFQSLVAVPRSARMIIANLRKYGHITDTGSVADAETPTATRANFDLGRWIAQGVLLVNKSLTVRIGAPNSHNEIWAGITERLIAHVPAQSVILTLGSVSAGIAAPCIDRVAHGHPAIDSVYFGDFDCFGAVNNSLRVRGLTPIDWTC